jgi:dephospho-CoA kinase
MILGLTGGIASGKSLVAEIFRAFGIPVIDTDVIARQVVAPGQPAWHALRAAFGADFFTPKGELDRAAMARRVFSDPEARRRLEGITHPAIFAAVDAQIAALQAQPSPPRMILVAVPLLFEVGAEDRFDGIIVIWATPEQQRERLITHRGYTPEEADARIAAQQPLIEKTVRGDFIIDNTGSVEETREQVEDLILSLHGMP